MLVLALPLEACIVNRLIVNMDETQPLLNHVDELSSRAADPPLVDFDPEGDPENPMDWSQEYKRSVVCLLAVMAFTV